MQALLKKNEEAVSVPIRGLFNLTQLPRTCKTLKFFLNFVSVPIRGLFNLTNRGNKNEN